MIEDSQLPKQLTEVEERKNAYIARQVESADQDRAVSRDAGPLETDDDHPEGVVSWIECSRDKRSWAEVCEEEVRKKNSFFIVQS